MADTNKCKHECCSCTVEKGQAYCSQVCQDAKKVTELFCQCNHAGCTCAPAAKAS